jgi:hypothetical protein
MKYYLGKIAETNGDMEYDAPYLFVTKGSPDRYAKKVAMEWRGCSRGDWDKEHGGYWSDCTLVRDDGWREIPKEDFDVLAKYLAVL